MIKRRFYKQDHGDKSDASSSSDSDSDSESVSQEDLNAVGEEGEEEGSFKNEEEELEEEEEEEEVVEQEIGKDLLSNEEEHDMGTLQKNLKDKQTGRPKLGKKEEGKETKRRFNKFYLREDDDCVLQYKSVFKCRICPRVVCLSEESLTAHLKSKGHARSKKLLKQGRLKVMLNSDCELEEEEETHAERHARMVALAEITSGHSKKNKGRQRQVQRRKAKLKHQADKNKTEQRTVELETEKPLKKKRKIKD